MKKVILVLVLISVSILAQSWMTDIQRTHKELSSAYIESIRMCKIVERKVKLYKHEMRDDELAIATLNHYKNQVDQYCGALVRVQND